ncbi:MAG: hypothetical protein LUG16_07210 [Candidatus Gastranaerophilales bacterium]|nr:hypothetical protein [Candidatus Gastranaerophilales bacterium]
MNIQFGSFGYDKNNNSNYVSYFASSTQESKGNDTAGTLALGDNGTAGTIAFGDNGTAGTIALGDNGTAGTIACDTKGYNNQDKPLDLYTPENLTAYENSYEGGVGTAGTMASIMSGAAALSSAGASGGASGGGLSYSA